MLRTMKGAPRAAALVVALLVLGGTGACSTARQDDTVGGSEWRTGQRFLVGSATSLAPAHLTGVEVEEHRGFDRVRFGLEGPLPDYRVGYRPADDGDGVLTVLLVHVKAENQNPIDCDLPAVAEVRREAVDAGSARTSVITKSRERLPFRIGISLDAVYLDVAHPDNSATEVRSD